MIAAAKRDEDRLVEVLEALIAELHKPNPILDLVQQALPLARRMAQDKARTGQEDENDA